MRVVAGHAVAAVHVVPRRAGAGGRAYGLTGIFSRVDGLRTEVGGDLKAGHLARHLAELGLAAASVVLIGDSLDDADAADSVGARCVLYTGGFTDPGGCAPQGVRSPRPYRGGRPRRY